MKRQQRVSASCPYCGLGMRVSAMECPSCGVQITGHFHQSLFQLLSDEDQRLLEQYLLAGFSIKALAASTGMGYVALRTRLDRLIASYQVLRDGEDATKAILAQVAKGELSAAEAAERIRSVTNGRK